MGGQFSFKTPAGLAADKKKKGPKALSLLLSRRYYLYNALTLPTDDGATAEGVYVTMSCTPVPLSFI
jgi:hypothetical protein